MVAAESVTTSRAVLRGIARLPDRPSLDVLRDLSNPELADLLLAGQDQLAPDLFVAGVQQVVTPWLDDLARRVCEQDHLLLDPIRLADDVVARIVLECTLGRHERPFARWGRRLLDVTIASARFDDAFSLVQPPPDASRAEQSHALICRMINESDTVVRRVLHMLYVRRMTAEAVADANDLTVEHVEWVFEQTLRRAMTILEESGAAPGEDGSTSWDEASDDGGEYDGP